MQIASTRNRLTFVVMIFATLAVVMMSRMAWIQVIGDPRLEKLAKRQFQSQVLITPRRGGIEDRTGEPLAINVEVSSLAGSPSKISKNRRSQNLLSKALGITHSQLKERIKNKKSFVWFARHLNDDQISGLKKSGLITESGEMPEGVWLVKEMKRVYPHGDLAAPLIGSVNIDTKGIEGIELWKNSILAGKTTKVSAVRDALGRTALFDTSEEIPLEDGKPIQLTIDASLQYSVESSLKEAISKSNADSGMVIVMDASNGEILALAQQPSFNPNHRNLAGASSPNRKLRAITDGFEPGSILKPILLASALSNGFKLNDKLYGHLGNFRVQGKPIREAEAHEKFGYISLKKMIEVSSNIVAANLALQEGAEKYVRTLRTLGFGSKTGIDFPGEISGWTPQNGKGMKPLTLANIGFGQGLLVTPMQVVRAYAALANGGYLIEPTLLSKTSLDKNANSEKIQIFHSNVVKDVTSALLSVTEGEDGTGKKARVTGYKIAGKTGTAQTVDSKTKTYSRSRYIASFVGYPVKTEKPLVVLTLLDHPRGIYYASETAAPLFSQVLAHATARFSIPPTEPVETPTQLVENPSPSPSPSASSVVIQASSATREVPTLSSMPNLMGLTPQEAMTTLSAVVPRFQIVGFGLVRRQSPEAGSAIEPGMNVTLYLDE